MFKTSVGVKNYQYTNTCTNYITFIPVMIIPLLCITTIIVIYHKPD